jgi:hypothetical protein
MHDIDNKVQSIVFTVSHSKMSLSLFIILSIEFT